MPGEYVLLCIPHIPSTKNCMICKILFGCAQRIWPSVPGRARQALCKRRNALLQKKGLPVMQQDCWQLAALPHGEVRSAKSLRALLRGEWDNVEERLTDTGYAFP